MAQNDNELCPLGRCQKYIGNHFRAGSYRTDGSGYCGGKLVKVVCTYKPTGVRGQCSVVEEIECTRCNYKRQVRVIRTYDITHIEKYFGKPPRHFVQQQKEAEKKRRLKANKKAEEEAKKNGQEDKKPIVSEDKKAESNKKNKEQDQTKTNTQNNDNKTQDNQKKKKKRRKPRSEFENKPFKDLLNDFKKQNV